MLDLNDVPNAMLDSIRHRLESENDYERKGALLEIGIWRWLNRPDVDYEPKIEGLTPDFKIGNLILESSYVSLPEFYWSRARKKAQKYRKLPYDLVVIIGYDHEHQANKSKDRRSFWNINRGNNRNIVSLIELKVDDAGYVSKVTVWHNPHKSPENVLDLIPTL